MHTVVNCPADNANNQGSGFASWPATNGNAMATGTCAAKYSGNPTRQCVYGGTWSAVTNPCTLNYCASVANDANALWPQVEASTTANGICLPDYTGAPTRPCNADGTFGTIGGTSCVRRTCAAATFNNAAFGLTDSGDSATGTCVDGYEGSVTAVCTPTGWGTMTGACTKKVCAASTDSNAIFTEALADTLVTGICESGYSGSAVRPCQIDGTWGTSTSTCTRIKCPAGINGNAAWPSTDSLTDDVSGTCTTGFTGSPKRSCLASGAWSSTITTPCVPTQCASEVDGVITWPATNAGTTASFTCPSTHTGSPTRECAIDGTWQAASGSCQARLCPALVVKGNAAWTSTAAGTTATGTCISGFQNDNVAPTMVCSNTATWAAVTNPCVPVTCAAVASEDGASWPLSNALNNNVAGTCLAASGYTGAPYRACEANGVFGTIKSPCTRRSCPATVVNGASFGVSPAAEQATGICTAAFTQNELGAPTLLCTQYGNWSTTVTNPCVPRKCDPITMPDGTSFPETNAGTSVLGNCPTSKYGLPRLACLDDGTWAAEGTITNPCIHDLPCPAIDNDEFTNFAATTAQATPQAIGGDCINGYTSSSTEGSNPSRRCTLTGWEKNFVSTIRCVPLTCTASSDNAVSADFPATRAGETATGVCHAGFQGSVSRVCNAEGNWNSPTGSCTRKMCPAVTEQNANWVTKASTEGLNGDCVSGYTGSPSRTCMVDGSWGPISNPCSRTVCNAMSDATADFGSTTAGTTSTGQCKDTYAATGGALPYRMCQDDGTFSTAVTGSCTAMKCSAVTNDGNADWAETAARSLVVQGTCVAGYTGNPTRHCDITLGTWTPVVNPCVRSKCPAENSAASVSWPETNSQTPVVSGVCKAGYRGVSTRSCSVSGTWTSADGQCVAVSCPLVTEGFAQWAAVASAASPTVSGTCVTGYTTNGSAPTRQCQAGGVWGPITNPCVQNSCATQTVGNAVWPVTKAGSTAVGVCVAGYAGSPTRECTNNGVFSNTITGSCVQKQCPAVASEGNARWNAGLAGSSAVSSGVCHSSFQGTATRYCLADGTWGDVLTSCTANFCDARPLFNATFTQTRGGLIATGTCNNNYRGNPTLQCLETGSWASAPITACVQIVPNCPLNVLRGATYSAAAPGASVVGICPDGFEGAPTRACSTAGVWQDPVGNCTFAIYNGTNIENVRATAKTSGSITLGWDLVNNATNVFSAFYSLDATTGYSAVTANGRFNSTSVTATGLSDYTVYYFRVYSGVNGTMDEEPAQLTVRTDFLPPTALLAVLSEDALTLNWEPSPRAVEYRVLSFVVAARDDTVPAGATVIASGFNETTYNVPRANLTAGTTYTFNVQGGFNGEWESTGASVSYSIPAENVISVVDESKGMYIGIGAGVAVLALIIIVVVSIVLYRRRQRKSKEVLEEFHAQFSMATFSSASLMPGADGTQRRTLQRSGSIGGTNSMNNEDGDTTVLNTVMEVTLPGFLKLNYKTQLRAENHLGSGGAGVIYKGQLLDTAITSRTGFSEVAIKEVQDWPMLSTEENEDRFHQEVSLMWSLSFHPAIIQLIGYTDEPRTIIIPIYATDLFRFLHSTDDATVPLDSNLFLHLISGISSGINAIHSMNVAHRDIKTANVLLRAPVFENSFPDPIICDFGLARAADMNIKKANIVVGFSPRYAAPEVFARAHVKGSFSTVEDDKKSDVYAFGVIVWEMYMRQIPWGDISNEDIEMSVRSGQQLPPVTPYEDDQIRVVLAGVATSCITQIADRRPSMVTVNSKIAALLPPQ